MFYEEWTYLGVFAVLLAAGLGLPLPEDVPLLTGGYLCYAGYANVAVMIGVGLVGVLIGDVMLFSIGRRLGHDVLRRRFFRRMVHPGRLLIAERLFARHGIKIILAGRFLPGLRPMIFMAAGVLRVPFTTFILVNGFAACVSAPLLVLLGFFFGYKLDVLKSEVREVTHVLVVCAAFVAIVLAGVYVHRRQKRMLAKAHLDERFKPALPTSKEGGGSQGNGPRGRTIAGEEAA